MDETPGVRLRSIAGFRFVVGPRSYEHISNRKICLSIDDLCLDSGTVAPVILHQRTCFASSMIDGRTVGEIKGEARSAEEIALLWDYVGHRLNRDLKLSREDAFGAEADVAQVAL